MMCLQQMTKSTSLEKVDVATKVSIHVQSPRYQSLLEEVVTNIGEEVVLDDEITGATSVQIQNRSSSAILIHVIDTNNITGISIRNSVGVDGTWVEDIAAVTFLTVLNAKIGIRRAGRGTILNISVGSTDWQKETTQGTASCGLRPTAKIGLYPARFVTV